MFRKVVVPTGASSGCPSSGRGGRFVWSRIRPYGPSLFPSSSASTCTEYRRIIVSVTGKALRHQFLPIPSVAIASEPSLEARLRHWIAEKATDDVAARFYPWIEKTLRSLEYDLEAPASEEKARQVREELQAADITPSRMERAVREARQAAEDEQSVLEWIRSVQKRAYSEKLAEKAFLVAKARLKGELAPGSTDLQGPPSPEQVFAFLLAWEELGGTSGLAALRELQRRKEEGLPSN